MVDGLDEKANVFVWVEADTLAAIRDAFGRKRNFGIGLVEGSVVRQLGTISALALRVVAVPDVRLDEDALGEADGILAIVSHAKGARLAVPDEAHVLDVLRL